MRLAKLACLALLTAVGGSVGVGGQSSQATVIPPGAGELLKYCGRPLSITLKADERTFPGTRLVAGIGDLHGDEGTATHRDGDEVIFVIEGTAEAVLGARTVALRPGSVAYIPQEVPHHLRLTGSPPFRYLWVLGPRSSADSFRRAASLGCDAPAPPAQQPASKPAITEGATAAFALEPGGGERIVYCELPLVLTMKVDSDTTAGARLRAATGSLRKGEELGVHRDADEVLYVTGGRGLAVLDQKRQAVEPGSLMFVPQGTPHGLINDSDKPLEYIVVHSPQASAAGFRRRAALPGPHCK